ncbi:MAG: RHS repeat domain-containing protein [Burkholderiales bacterium]
MTDALNGITALTYDAHNRLASVSDARDHLIETYAHDAVGRLTRKTGAKRANETYRYDSAGNLTETTDRKGRTSTFSHDEQNRVSEIRFPDGPSRSAPTMR